MKANIYYCKSATEATDKAHLYYISSPIARTIKREGKKIIIESKSKVLAVFQY